MEDLPVPLSRVELYLAKACGMDVTVPEAPESRLEQYLAILAGDTSVEMPAPMSLTEQWLAYVLGVTPDPLLAVEGACYIGNQKVDVRYFAVAAGMPGAVLPPAPQNRKEQYWANIHGGGGGVLKYATGTNIALTDVVRGIEELQYVYGDTVQDGTPTPDAPVAIQTVTGEQTVGVHGKNLMNYSTYDVTDGRIMYMPDLIFPSGTFTISFDLESFTLGTGNSIDIFLYLYDENRTGAYSDGVDLKSIFSINTSTQTGRYSYTFTTNAITHNNNTNFRIGATQYNNGARCRLTNIQIEAGSTATTYQPYQSNSYTINLGSIELCKIGTYQDYIYKSGGDWYVHKVTNSKLFNGVGQSISVSQKSNPYVRMYSAIITGMESTSSDGSQTLFYSNNFKAGIWNDTFTQGECIIQHNGARRVYFIIYLSRLSDTSTTEATVASFKTWLSTNNVTVYYRLETPTDTKITDNTLISQLNAVNNATLPTPVATISVTTDGTSLPGALKISYYGEEE